MGGASTAANAGVPDRLFKKHGRWKSENAKKMAISKIPWTPGSGCPDRWGSDATASLSSGVFMCVCVCYCFLYVPFTDPSLLPYMCAKVDYYI